MHNILPNSLCNQLSWDVLLFGMEFFLNGPVMLLTRKTTLETRHSCEDINFLCSWI